MWRFWWCVGHLFGYTGLIIAWPGCVLLDIADWCQRRELRAREPH